LEERHRSLIEQITRQDGNRFGRPAAVLSQVDDQGVRPPQQAHGIGDDPARLLSPPEGREIEVPDVACQDLDALHASVCVNNSLLSRVRGWGCGGRRIRRANNGHHQVLVICFH
jgi:hypothetical protein